MKISMLAKCIKLIFSVHNISDFNIAVHVRIQQATITINEYSGNNLYRICNISLADPDCIDKTVNKIKDILNIEKEKKNEHWSFCWKISAVTRWT